MHLLSLFKDNFRMTQMKVPRRRNSIECTDIALRQLTKPVEILHKPHSQVSYLVPVVREPVRHTAWVFKQSGGVVGAKRPRSGPVAVVVRGHQHNRALREFREHMNYKGVQQCLAHADRGVRWHLRRESCHCFQRANGAETHERAFALVYNKVKALLQAEERKGSAIT